jgi:periplasmic divalent cation tolerance protein
MTAAQGNVLFVFVTVPSQAVAKRISRFVVEQRFAACVNIVSGVLSIYRWKGRMERGRELLLIIKTTRRNYAMLEKAVRRLHPYEVPEIIGVQTVVGLPQYLEWVHSESHN